MHQTVLIPIFGYILVIYMLIAISLVFFFLPDADQYFVLSDMVCLNEKLISASVRGAL